jgi:hypothetical protein
MLLTVRCVIYIFFTSKCHMHMTFGWIFNHQSQIMRNQKKPGVIINIGSAAGLYPMFLDPVYSAAKGIWSHILFSSSLLLSADCYCNIEGHVWCNGESCLIQLLGYGFEAASLHFCVWVGGGASLGLSLFQIPLRASSFWSQSMWIGWDWVGFNPEQVKIFHNFL